MSTKESLLAELRRLTYGDLWGSYGCGLGRMGLWGWTCVWGFVGEAYMETYGESMRIYGESMNAAL